MTGEEPDEPLTTRTMSVEKNRKLLLSVFNAIEQRNDQRFSKLLHSDFEIHWPPSLPYGEGKSKTWTETWNPFQPTELERRMDPLHQTVLLPAGPLPDP